MNRKFTKYVCCVYMSLLLDLQCLTIQERNGRPYLGLTLNCNPVYRNSLKKLVSSVVSVLPSSV